MRLPAGLLSLILLVFAAACGPSEDGAKCGTDADCVNRCIDAVCTTPRGEGQMCAHGQQCGDLECASWNQIGRCSVPCTSSDDCGGRSCEWVPTVAGEGVQVCKPSNVIDVPSCTQACDNACNEATQSCQLCKQACQCRCIQDQACATQASDRACALGRCGC